jgi:hypothetical protein
MGSPIIVFPSDLLQLTGPLSYPQIEFTVQEDATQGNNFTSIYLPMPGSVAFSDGGSYGTIELGDIAGAGGLDAITSLMEGNFGAATTMATSAAKQQINSLKPRVQAMLISKLPGIDKETAMFAQKKIKAPNQNTTFTGNNLREFTFSFKLIANSARDTEAISNIHRTFRRYTYAGSSDNAPNVVLDYPPLWKIQFLQGDKENRFMPKIFSCYLTTLACTFNGEANIFRIDGSPFDVSFSVTFKETRVLTRNDIDALDPRKSNLGIDPKTGLAASSQPAGTKIPVPSPATATTGKAAAAEVLGPAKSNSRPNYFSGAGLNFGGR